MPKTNAETCREYRQRKKEKENKIKKVPKSSTERVREFRARRNNISNASNNTYTVQNSENNHYDSQVDVLIVPSDASIGHYIENNDSILRFLQNESLNKLVADTNIRRTYRTMDSSIRLIPDYGTSSTAAPEVLWNLQMAVPAVKQEKVDITYEEDVPCSDFMYPSGPLESTEYVNNYNSKIYVLEQLKKEIPEEECPQSGNTMNNKEVFENKELLEEKQKIKKESTEEGLLLNIKEEDEDIEYPCGIKTVWIEEQRVSASDGDASARDALLTPQVVECKSSGRIFENGINRTMNNKEHRALSCETLSNTAPEVQSNQHIYTPTMKVDIKQETTSESRDEEESSRRNYTYPSEPLQSPEYVNFYDSKMYVLEQLKKEFPEDECPQSDCSLNGKIVSENTELLTPINKQKVIIDNTEEEFTLNLNDANGNRNNQITIKTERLEEQDITDNSGATSVHYDDLVTPQKVKSKFCDRILKNNYNFVKRNSDHIKIEINTQVDNEINELHQGRYCDKRYDNYNNMLTQVTDVHSENDSKCELCGKQFNSVPNLKRHVKLFHKLNNLPNQVLNNLPNQVLNNLPNQVFNNLPNQVNPNDMKCIYCHVDFEHKHTLDKHMRLCRTGKEDEGMEYKCELCERIYKMKWSLVSHMKKSHYDYGRMFSCWCGKQFPSPIHLSEHKSRQHSSANKKNESYTCNYCEMVFNMKSALTDHIKRMHYDYGRTFECWCGKEFRTPLYLRMHLKRQHGD